MSTSLHPAAPPGNRYSRRAGGKVNNDPIPAAAALEYRPGSILVIHDGLRDPIWKAA